jgi:predicted kinase
MRKWMRDKLRRRKKAQEEAAESPAPLQPAYFSSEPEAPASSATAPPDVPPGETEHAPEGDTSEQIAQTAQTGPSPGQARRPRRRRRGGRGRRRSGQRAAPSTAAPAGLPTPASGPAEPPAPTSQPQHATKGVVVLAIGLPGSGKSSWFKRHNITPLSSDMLRSLLFDDPAEQGFQDLVFSNLRSMLRARLLARRPVNYVDATNLTPHERHSWIKLAKDFGYEVHAVFFDVPLEVCLERNHRRQRVVSDDIMRNMSAKLRPPTFDEGFSKITVVRVKQQSPA